MDINWGHVILDCFEGAMDKAIIVATSFDAIKTKEKAEGPWIYVEMYDRDNVELMKFKYNWYDEKFKLISSLDLERYRTPV